MNARLRLTLLSMGLVAAWLSLWPSGPGNLDGDSPLFAARYHARHRTSQFFQRSGQQGSRSFSAAARTGESVLAVYYAANQVLEDKS